MIKRYIAVAVCCILGFTACEKYLDKAPESTLKEEDVFVDFVHAQGFLERMYYYVVNYAQVGNQPDASNFLLGDESLIFTTGMCSGGFDLGRLDIYKLGYFYRSWNYDDNQPMLFKRRGIWDGWEAIRRANQIIANEPLMTGCTQTEKNLLLGQAFFFRAYFHMEIMKFWGAIPYVDKVLTGNNGDFKLKRPAAYRESAMRCDEDFRRALELLPWDWDDLKTDPKAQFLTFKEETFGKNTMRINKTIVYSYIGKNLLLAASPLMRGSRDTYDYDKELCEKAAEAFAHVIARDRAPGNKLGLATKDNYWKTFHTEQVDNKKWPGTAEYMGNGQGEYIFSSVAGHPNGCRSLANMMMPYTPANNVNRVTPSHHFVHRTFGTSHGLPCDEDKTHDFQKEFDDRDPRFYINHLLDGDTLIEKPAAKPEFKYAQLYVGGRESKVGPLITGYFIKKWCNANFNYPAKTPGGISDGQCMITDFWLSMRLTDVYLMYAEALAASVGPVERPKYDFLDDAPAALEVVNMFRDRFNVPHAETAYLSEYCRHPVDITADAHKFMDVLRIERATEMCYEGHRWMDIRRWQLADREEYRVKTALRYDRDHKKPGPRGSFRNINFREEHVRTRVCEYPKHFWLPFPTEMTQLYEGFEQNPGW